MQNKRVGPSDGSDAVIKVGQTWRGKRSQTLVDILGTDPKRSRRWRAHLHGAEVVASFSEEDLRTYYDLVD